MRHVIALGLFVNAALLALALVRGIPVRAWQAEAAGGSETDLNGDVNGDGDRDVSDVIYLLDWLFQGGPRPVAFASDGDGLDPDAREILDHMELIDLPDELGGATKTIRLSGVNLQIVNGTGSTLTKNGAGNLIIGYQEVRGPDDFEPANDRSGSHNLVIGLRHNYSAIGGLIAGLHNSVTANHGSVTGGSSNRASGIAAAIPGGSFNRATGSRALVAGGAQNHASADFSTLVGGQLNSATGGFATGIGGGGPFPQNGNQAAGDFSVVAGGGSNHANGHWSFVGGGAENSTGDASDPGRGRYSAAVGGSRNRTVGDTSAAVGGRDNRATGGHSLAAGAQGNDAAGDFSIAP